MRYRVWMWNVCSKGGKKEYLIKADMKTAVALVQIRIFNRLGNIFGQKILKSSPYLKGSQHQLAWLIISLFVWQAMNVVGNSIQHNRLMQAVTTPAGKLLLFIRHLHAHSAITTQERALLKDMVVSAEPAIFHAQQQYEQAGTELTFTSDLKRLLQTAKTHRRGESEAGRMKRSISISIPQRNIQKLPEIDNRI